MPLFDSMFQSIGHHGLRVHNAPPTGPILVISGEGFTDVKTVNGSGLEDPGTRISDRLWN
ncbi:MAG: hypothetical protein CM1200mP35_03220 [Chloroflexota bacterium]|nr:MAG: hypothetical protein CM1200mP35_03220 [Chloroflexota bacterium]